MRAPDIRQRECFVVVVVGIQPHFQSRDETWKEKERRKWKNERHGTTSEEEMQERREALKFMRKRR